MHFVLYACKWVLVELLLVGQIYSCCIYTGNDYSLIVISLSDTSTKGLRVNVKLMLALKRLFEGVFFCFVLFFLAASSYKAANMLKSNCPAGKLVTDVSF